jgi:ketosteroid isomerase-like protein
MTGNSNLQLLESAYKAFEASTGDASAWLPLMPNDFRLASMADGAGPSLSDGKEAMSFAKTRNSKEEVLAYFSDLIRDWRLVHWTPETYVCDGDSIAMFGRCAWVNKATTKTAEVRIAHLWKFRDGKMSELTEVFDSARVVAAAST